MRMLFKYLHPTTTDKEQFSVFVLPDTLHETGTGYSNPAIGIFTWIITDIPVCVYVYVHVIHHLIHALLKLHVHVHTRK